MSLIKKMLFYAAVVSAAGAAVVLACGPFLGVEVLQDRQETLLAPPTISFETELKSLVPPPKDKLPVVEPDDRPTSGITQSAGETADWTPEVLARFSAMRQQSDGDAAYSLGEGLPSEIRLYSAGAVSFFHGQAETARGYFQKVLYLPEQERKSRELRAHYMLGRMAVQAGNQPEAVVQFEATRALVRQGLPDELGLAVASFGEQARGAWRHGEVANAVELYARQASYGSQSGLNSLVLIAGLILKDADLLDKGIQDSVTRRLLFICLNNDKADHFFIDINMGRQRELTVDRIAAALSLHQLTRVEGAGLLASAAYSKGRFDLAEQFSVLDDVPISHWIRAKLALRKGDRETALSQYEQALKTFRSPIGGPVEMRAEVAVLLVSRQDYIQALDLFYGADYWSDAAYLAERVLTIEELRDYLNRNIPLTPALNANEKAQRSQLRGVLARRLMRAGKRREAFDYFDDAKIRETAAQYSEALDRAAGWWHLPLTKAKAWFTAAVIARSSGMEILSFEKEPDYALWSGNYGQDFDQPGRPGMYLYQTEDERKRIAASAPRNDVRFQYRLTAVEHATQAADLLPRSSQAFAAVLCHATEWVINREPNRAEKIYQRYLHQGAHVSWGRSFGRSCPEPNFEAASFGTTRLRQLKHWSRHARVHPILAGLLALLSGTLLTAIGYYYLGLRKQRFT